MKQYQCDLDLDKHQKIQYDLIFTLSFLLRTVGLYQAQIIVGRVPQGGVFDHAESMLGEMGVALCLCNHCCKLADKALDDSLVAITTYQEYTRACTSYNQRITFALSFLDSYLSQPLPSTDALTHFSGDAMRGRR